MSRKIGERWSSKTVGWVNYEISHPHQPAALIELSRYYAGLDTTRYSDQKMRTIRRTWMRKQVTFLGKENLKCEICGKTDLKLTGPKQFLATLDHVISISKCYSLWNNWFNFQIACHPCNSGKSNSTEDEFCSKLKS
jgi:5-methylcytosine-specific restriction endonuclease McrA